MKVGLFLVSFSLVGVAQATYDLSCAKSELSIRWPSYESNSEYYVCSRLYGRKMAVSCNPGEVFTFVLQSCTSPNRYIPAPAVENLPTAAPLPNEPNEDDYLKPLDMPNHPPLLSPPSLNMPVLQPQAGPPTLPPAVVVEEHTSENGVAIVEEIENVTPPLPPTPAPTPPLVEKVTSKKPAGKKPVTKKKKTTTTNKKPAVAGKQTSKKPKAAAGKKTATQKSAKPDSKASKTPKTPKSPKKSVKTSNAKDKKTKKQN